MSFCYFLYLSATEPYVKRTTNSYVAAVEFLYFVLVAVAFLLTDACADVDIKVYAAWISVILLMAYILANIIVTVRLVRRSKEELKSANNRYKTFRIKEMKRRELEKYEKDLRAKAREDRKNEKLREKFREEALAAGKPEQMVEEEVEHKMNFRFKAGKRLVDMGVMSDETGSEEEDHDERIRQARVAYRQERKTPGASSMLRDPNTLRQPVATEKGRGSKGKESGRVSKAGDKRGNYAETEMKSFSSDPFEKSKAMKTKGKGK